MLFRSIRADDPARARATLERVPHVARVLPKTGADGFTTFRLELSDEGEIGEALGDLVRREGWALRELRRDDRSLEQVFRDLGQTAVEARA